jgi:hypothetical protein
MNSLRPNRLSALALVGALLAMVSDGPADPVRNARPPESPALVRPHGALLVDDFSDGLKQWEPDRSGIWSIRGGVLRADMPDGKQERSFLYGGSEQWSNYAVDLDVCGMRGVDKGVVVRVQGGSGLGVDLRGPGYQDVLLHRREWPLGKASAVNGNAVWHHLRVETFGARVRVFVNGELKIDRGDSRVSTGSGRIALAGYTGGVGEATVYYDNVVVTLLSELAEGPSPRRSRSR